MPPPLADHGTPNRWRTGCRCDDCRAAHNTDLRATRRARSDREFPAAARKRALRLLAGGHSTAAVAEQVGVTWQAMYARTRYDEDWARRLDEALTAGRDPQLAHGTETAYRHGRCRCPDCRAAHHPPVR